VSSLLSRLSPCLIVSSLLASGCGYHVGFVPRPGLHSIAVPVFENKTLRRELEVSLTQAVIQEIQQRTPLRVAPGARADAVLEGTILDFREQVLVEGPDDEVLESQAVITLAVRLRDARTGRVIFAYGAGPGATGPPLTEVAEFVPGRGESAESAGTTGEAFRDLAARVVFLLERDTLRPRVPPLPAWIPLPEGLERRP